MKKQMNKLAKARIDAVVYELKHTYSDFIYPLSRIMWEECPENGVECLSTDGMTIYYEPDLVLRAHKISLKQGILHIIFHGLLGHFQIKDDYKEKLYRDIIMDVQAAYLMSRLAVEPSLYSNSISMYEKLLDNDFSMGQYYKLPQKKELITNLDYYRYHIKVDNHLMWDKKTGKEQKKLLVIFWKDIQNVVLGEDFEEEVNERDLLRKIADILEKSLCIMYGNQRGESESTFAVGRAGQQDYGELLQELFRMREVSRVEPDSIDPMFYHYGLELYEDMPLIEPLEVCERQAFHTLVIAIDVSGSCTAEFIMKSFWGETYQCISQLKERHAEGEVLVLQCDAAVQREERIELTEFTEVPNEVAVTGRGGTSFVPVFERLEELKEKGTVVDALIYLTDGCGAYPEKVPDYPVYFVLPEVFRDVRMRGYEMPDWISRVYLKEENGEV